MHILKEPAIAFSGWTPWLRRPRLSDCIDVPLNFDFGGLYLFAHFPNSKHTAVGAEASHLSPEVIYIGMSKRLTGRTQNHEKIARLYKTKFADPQFEFLYLAHCELGLGWVSWDLTHKSLSSVKLAFIQYAERRLIWEYAKEFNRLPSLNVK